MLYDRRDSALLHLAGALHWIPLAPLRTLSPLGELAHEADLLAALGLLTYARSGAYLMPSPKGYALLRAMHLPCRPPAKRPYTGSPALRRRLETGAILLTCLAAGITPAWDTIKRLCGQPLFFPAFPLRYGDGNLLGATVCSGLGHWGDTAYQLQYVSQDSSGFFITNELANLHRLSSAFDPTCTTPQALILAGQSYRAVFSVLTREEPSARHGRKGYVDYSQAYPRLELPACLLSCDDTGALQLAVMRQAGFPTRIARAAFGSRWRPRDDRIPDADGQVDGNPLVIAVDMDLRRLDRVCRQAAAQGRREILVAALEGQMNGLLLDVLPRGLPVRPLAVNPRVLSVAFGADCATGIPWSDEPLHTKDGPVHV